MTLAPLRLAILQGWAAADIPRDAVRDALLGRVLVLPAELPQAERDEVVDLLALFAGLAVHVSARASELPGGHLCLLTDPIEGELRGVDGSIVLGVRQASPGNRCLEASEELRALRDVVVDAVAQHQAGTPLEGVADGASAVADSPSLALRFASAAMARHLSDRHASGAELFAAGLAATVGWLLRGIDVRVAQWVLARALPAKHPERLVDTEAAILGEDAALRRAFAAGLIEGLPEEPGGVIDLRRPFQLLGDPTDSPPDMEFATLAKELREALAPEVYVVVDRFLGSAPKPLGLTGPARPRDFVGRGEVLKRLRSLFEPSDTVSTVVLYGIEGSGRTAVAAAFCEMFSGTLEPVWVTFAGGAASGWVPIANALDVEMREDTAGARVPAWVKRVHTLLRDRPCLMVVSDVGDVSEAELPEWLPSGPGQCAVLVLSGNAQRALQRTHDAIAVPLRPLSLEESKELLAGKVPKLAEAIRGGEADGLLKAIDGHPGALRMAAGLLEKQSVAGVEALAKHREGPARVLVEKAIAALDEAEAKLVDALAVCTPEGSPPVLALGFAGVEDSVLRRLEDKALVVASRGRVRLHGLVRLAMERELGDTRDQLEEAHATRVAMLLEDAQKTEDGEMADTVYEDALLGLRRMTRSYRSARGLAQAELVRRLADGVRDYPRGNFAVQSTLVIDGYRALLATYAMESHPLEWAASQARLGIALNDLRVGNRSEILHDAIEAFRAALTVYTRDAFPERWAHVQNNLGNAFFELQAGDRHENLRRAIVAYEAALTVRTRHTAPKEWASTQNNLGNALVELGEYDGVRALQSAIGSYYAALRVRSDVSAPTDWANTMNGLGNALSRLQVGNKEENVRRAIDAYEAALTVLTRERFPRDWAMIQLNLGAAFAVLPAVDKDASLRRAIEAYRTVLTVYPKDQFPSEWAKVHANIGWAFAQMLSGDRAQSLRDAIDSFRAALTIWTAEACPRDHARLQAYLAAALHDLAALEAPAEP